MKVLLIYGAWGNNHESQLRRNIPKYAAYDGYRFEIILMASRPLEIELPENAEYRYFDHSLGMAFLWKHQDVIREKERSDFDLLVFAEDDVLVTKDNLDYFRQHSENLKDSGYMPGFVSYENWDGERFLHSMTIDSWNAGRETEIGDERYWTVNERNRMLPNIHQCSFMFDRAGFDDLIAKGLFYVKPEAIKYGTGNRYLGPRESATNWMWKYCYHKAWALDDIDRALILHDDHYGRSPIGPKVEDWKAVMK